MAITRYNFGKNIRSIWDKEKEPNQWKALSDYIISQNPNKIGINISDNYGIADGLAKTDFDGIMNSLPNKFQKRIVSAESLAVRWIETRTPIDMTFYNILVDISHYIIK